MKGAYSYEPGEEMGILIKSTNTTLRSQDTGGTGVAENKGQPLQKFCYNRMSETKPLFVRLIYVFQKKEKKVLENRFVNVMPL